jgi:hypothetical protein
MFSRCSLRELYVVLLGLALLHGLAATGWVKEPPSYVRDIRPILARHCYACHGPDESHREAELRLDVAGAAVETGAITAGQPDESELVRRIFSDDPDEQMPPAEASTQLSQRERNLLRDWIAAGAEYQKHWAFVRPTRPTPPNVKRMAWLRNDIDRFVLARIEQAGLQVATEADRYTLIRRLYLDLIGLPPSVADADAFVADKDPQAYERIVSKLLDSDHYGERWARQWLDLARYSDTNGYEKDRPRSIWPFRDWVIKALNDDMPFDRFTVEQLAGDMLPHATNSQRIATGFHRNTMLNEEGGIDPLEFRFYAMVDRVATTGTVWMGLTTGCAQCHTHKYDPLSHTDYYRLMALLNNADEPDLSVHDATIGAQREAIERKIAELETTLVDQFPPAAGDQPLADRRRQALEEKFAAWIEIQSPTTWTVLRPGHLETNLPKLEVLKDGSIFSSGDITKRDVFTLSFPLVDLEASLTALRLEVLADDRLPAGGPGRAFYEGRKGDFFLSEVIASTGDQPAEFTSGSHSFGKISIGSGNANAANVFDGEGSTGWATAGREGESHQLVLRFAKPLEAVGTLTIEMVFERHFAASLGRFRISATSRSGDVKATAMPVEVETLLALGADSWTPAQRQEVQEYYLRVAPELAVARKKIDQLRKTLPEFSTSMVMQERPADNPRKTARHHRGEYLNPREEVTAGLPEFFVALDRDGKAEPQQFPTDRLSLARWLASDRNPLVARVTVNRAWRSFFGVGLMRTSGDFGTQSEPPTHPDLLDWLACEFMKQGWSMKTLHRLIVTSATYRQDSRVTSELLERDPHNRLLARGPRFRVDAETVRDIMLTASGLLAGEIGGRSVYPPQPAGVTALAYGNTKWSTSKGSDRFRRSLYTFSKRTAPFAAYTVFDGPTGENCTARRDRSNTPLQSLTLLNDPMFLELARGLARQTLADSQAMDLDPAERDEALVVALFRRLITRPPIQQEREALLQYYQTQRKRLAAGELDAAKIGDEKSASAETAAWVMTVRAIMNLDEAITKE